MTRIFSLIMLWLIATLVLSPWSAPATAQGIAPAALFRAEELDQLVAPIALYPDSLLAQVLMASTYPLEIVSAARWVKANPKLKDKALDDALQTQTWDPSVKSPTVFPEVLTMMNEKLDWTQKLGDAFLAQQTDVMQAVQRLRSEAQAQGNLKTTKEQKVIVEPMPVSQTPREQGVVVEQPAASQTTIIRIEPANPQVVYVPTYNPTVVYGAWPYPAYPPYAYYPPGYVAATSLFSFGVGVAVGSALWGNCNWGHGDVDINVNNYNNFNRTAITSGTWEHNVEHRKGVQYRDSVSQQKFNRTMSTGGDAREAFRGRAESGRQQLAHGGAEGVRRDLERANVGAERRDRPHERQIADRQERERVVREYEESHSLAMTGEAKAVLQVGKDDWPMPIPLVKEDAGWRFDTPAGKEEILNRRIGRNELAAIVVCRAYVDAQREYYLRNTGRDALHQYAQKFLSTKSKNDGLYWVTKDSEEPSPLGPLIARAQGRGYVKAKDVQGKPLPYYGYYYRILKSQGADAPGGAYDYVVRGKMIGGFALVAYPANWGNSGVMTFIVNHDGIVYQKDLGPDTAAAARAITRFDPDSTWTRL